MPAMETAQKTVLYIEDDIASQRLVQRVLGNHGYRVTLASEGLEGIERAREVRPDVILMDINLPGMDGRAITTRLRSLAGFSNTPIVALTANAGDEYRERALAAGCDGFLTKPIDVVSFPREVENYLSGYREQQDSEERLLHLERHAQQIVGHLEEKIRALRESNRRLRELDRMKSDFIAVVSHELRTPLTLVEGYMHLLQETVHAANTTDPGLRALVEGLDGGVNRLAAVIGEIINVSRIEAGTLQLFVGPVHLSTVVDAVRLRLDQSLNERRLQLHVAPLAQLPLIEADGRQLAIALENVVGNAIKFTPDGGEIIISARVVSDAIDLVVADTGIGIPLDEQPHIFDQFYALQEIDHHSTSKSAFQGGGLGLGLAITRGIIEAHGGRVWVESEGRDRQQLPGSTFHLLLPVRSPDAAPDISQ
jgi:signal transduction histidine kinase